MTPSVNILGLVSKTHDTGLALLCDGRPKVIFEEERFNRQKHTKAFPQRSFEILFDNAENSLTNIHYITIPWNTKLLAGSFFRAVTGNMPASLNLLRPAAHATQDGPIVNLWMRCRSRCGGGSGP